MDLEKFYREDHAFYKFITGDFNAKEEISEFVITTKTTHGKSQFQKPSTLRWTWESRSGGYRNERDHIIVNERFCLTNVAVVPKFYTGSETLSDHSILRKRFSFARREEKAEREKFRDRSLRTIINWDLLRQRHLSAETLELIRQRGAARAAGNQELTLEHARLSREEIKEHLKERSAESFAEVAEAGKSIRYARRDFAIRKTRMTSFRNPKGTTITSRRGVEKIIYDFYSDLFDSRVHLPPHHLREDGHIIPELSTRVTLRRTEKVLD